MHTTARESHSGAVWRAYKEVEDAFGADGDKAIDHNELRGNVRILTTKRGGIDGQFQGNSSTCIRINAHMHRHKPTCTHTGFIIAASTVPTDLYEQGLDFMTVIVVIRKSALFEYRTRART